MRRILIIVILMPKVSRERLTSLIDHELEIGGF